MKIISQITKNPFLRNSTVLFAGTMLVNVLNYLFHLVIGRMVSPIEYGEIESLISLLTIISVGAGTLTLIATKHAARMKGGHDVVGTRNLATYLNKQIVRFGLPLFVVMILFTPLVKEFLNIETSTGIILLWGTMLISFLSAVIIGVLTGWQKFSEVNTVNITSTVIKFFGAVGFIYMGLGSSGVVLGLLVAAGIGYLVSWCLLRRLTSREGAESSAFSETPDAIARSVKEYLAPAFFGTLAVAIFGNADMIFAKHHLTGEVTGEYGALSVVAKTIFFVTGVVTTVLFAMSSEVSTTNRSKSAETFRFAVWLTTLVSGSSVLIFSLFPEAIVGLLFGEKYLAVSRLLGWFALAAGLYSLASLCMQYLLSLHETKIVWYLLALSSLEIGALAFFGVSLYAIIGITILTQLGALFLGIFYIIQSHRYVQSHLDSRSSL